MVGSPATRLAVGVRHRVDGVYPIGYRTLEIVTNILSAALHGDLMTDDGPFPTGSAVGIPAA